MTTTEVDGSLAMDNSVNTDQAIAELIQEDEEKAIQVEGDYYYAKLQAKEWSSSPGGQRQDDDEALASAVQAAENDEARASDSMIVNMHQEEENQQCSDDDLQFALLLQAAENDEARASDSLIVNMHQEEENKQCSETDFQYALLLQEEEDRRVAEELESQFKRENQQSHDQQSHDHHHQHHHQQHIRGRARRQHNRRQQGQLNNLAQQMFLPHLNSWNGQQASQDEDTDDDYEENWQLAEQLGEAKSQGLRKTQINALPTTTFQNTGASSDDKDCKVCWCDFDEGETVRVLPCLHKYHMVCIDPWLLEKPTCPICRIDVKEELKKS